MKQNLVKLLRQEYSNINLSQTDKQSINALLKKAKLDELLMLQNAEIGNIENLVNNEIYLRLLKETNKWINTLKGKSDDSFQNAWSIAEMSLANKFNISRNKAKITLTEQYKKSFSKNPNIKQATLKNPVKYLLVDENFKKIRESNNEDVLQTTAKRLNEREGKEKYFVMTKTWGNVENPNDDFGTYKVVLRNNDVLYVENCRAILPFLYSLRMRFRSTQRVKFIPQGATTLDAKFNTYTPPIDKLQQWLKGAENPKFIKSNERLLIENDMNKAQNISSGVKDLVRLKRKIMSRATNRIPLEQLKDNELRTLSNYGEHFEVSDGYVFALKKALPKDSAFRNPKSNPPIYKWLREDVKRMSLEQLKRQIERLENIQGYETEVKIYKTELAKRKKPNFTNADFNNFKKQRLNDLTQMFQGEVKGTKYRLLQSDFAPKDASILGQLVLMKVKRNGKDITINFDGESFLTMDLRKNLWVKGKDSKINGLSALGIKKPTKNNFTVIGDLIQTDYITAKKHIENGELTHFYHHLGEVNKEYPKLAIDYDGFPIILGGGYDIWNVGIVN